MPTDDLLKPLDHTHLIQINDALDKIALGLKAAEMATRAGIDVAQHIKTLQDSEKRLLAIKQVYFPGM